MRSGKHQRGVALLAAILLVAVATILAAAIAFKSAMAARRGAASLTFDASVLVAQGAEALAAYYLRDDNNGKDDFRDDWATPFPPTEITPGVILAASLEDLQGRFNLNSLLYDNDKVDPDALESLQNLLDSVGVEPEWADRIADWISNGIHASGANGLDDSGTTSQNPPYRTANTWITSASELLALPEFGRDRYLKIAPYVAALPPGAQLNICTASGIVLNAMLERGNLTYGDPKILADFRKKDCHPVLAQYRQDVRGARPRATPKLEEHFKEESTYFRLTSLVTIGGTDFALYSLLQRPARISGQQQRGPVRVLQRSFTPD